MRLRSLILGVAIGYASSTTAIGSSFSPKSGITYTIAIPSATASSGSGAIYLQLSALTTHSWVGLGIGSQMAGATMFIIYTAGTTNNNNVTISPRQATGHYMPDFNSSADITLLEGSGISNGYMTANVRYVASANLLPFSSTQAPFISSWQLGPPLNSASPSATITQHDGHDQLTFDLTRAVIPADANPFVASQGGNGTAVAPPLAGTGAPAAGGSAGNEAQGSAVTVTADVLTVYEMTHGILMAGVVVVLLPLGALVMRVWGSVWLHAGLQVFSLGALVAGFGVGIRLAQLTGFLFNTSHTLFGVVLISLFVAQPFLGLLHHRQYQKLGHRSYFGISHVWYGRALLIMGIVNGGLGLQLANNTTKGVIAYSVVAGGLFVVYLLVAALTRRKKVTSEVIEQK